MSRGLWGCPGVARWGAHLSSCWELGPMGGVTGDTLKVTGPALGTVLQETDMEMVTALPWTPWVSLQGLAPGLCCWVCGREVAVGHLGQLVLRDCGVYHT